MEKITLFEASYITAKDKREFIKTLMLTCTDDDNIHAYTSFGLAEDSINGMVLTSDFRNGLELKSIMFVGRFNNQSRYAATLEFLDVDGKNQSVTVVYTQVY